MNGSMSCADIRREHSFPLKGAESTSPFQGEVELAAHPPPGNMH
jgi:hypothetical protein